jgi:hypothetical protein
MIDFKEVSKMTWAIIGGIIVLAGVVGGTVGALTFLRGEFAPIALADQVNLQGLRLEQKITQDNITATMWQMRQIQISCGTNEPLRMNTDAQRHYYQLEQNLQKYNQQMQQLMKKGKQ